MSRKCGILSIRFNLFACKEYHSFFQPLETTRYELLSDKMGFHFFELPKLPTDIREDDMLLLWMSLFNADTEEELDKISKMEVPLMSEAINAYNAITSMPEYRELERIREKARYEEAQALYTAKKEEKIALAQKLLKNKFSLEEVMEYTELSYEEVKRLRLAIK